jgi:general stress protein YciG
MMANNENLIPLNSKRAAEIGAKGGKNKAGSKHLKTLIQEIGNNIDWDKTTLKDKEGMRAKYGRNGWTALTYVAFTKALAGDPKAMDWLAKNGYGLNIDHTSNGETINVIIDSSYEREPNFRIDNPEADKLATDSQSE